MARPLRIEFAGALYHVTSRGDRQESIYEDDTDREAFLTVLAEVVERFHWTCHAYCLMPNHYHLVIETAEANLSKGMRQMNGVYTQASNRRHGRAGHLFQGRYKGILVDKDAYLMELSRYVVLNPVRAGMVESPEEWPWSSYRAMIGKAPAPKWLAVDGLVGQFSDNRRTARRRFQRFVRDGMGEAVWDKLRQQIYLGDESFVEKMQSNAQISGDSTSIPRFQQRPPAPSLADIAAQQDDRNAAIVAAYATGAYSYRRIAEHFGIHLATVGRIVRSAL
ncbi:MAG: transposase [Gammaproteobacteria bacterium]|nr:transposase [Gammaproteobacteria bacterium]MCP5459839.1 transposase [Gammaproteobacteria bacterium]